MSAGFDAADDNSVDMISISITEDAQAMLHDTIAVGSSQRFKEDIHKLLRRKLWAFKQKHHA